MSLRSLWQCWNDFFFAPQRPTPIALYRIFFGLLVIADLLLLYPDWLVWFGEKGVMRLDTMQRMSPGPHINLFTILPAGDGPIVAFFWGFLLMTCLLTVGCCTRLSSIVVFLGLTSMHQRNSFILNAGDTLLRTTSFFLMFAPAGAALSIDRLIRLSRGTEGVDLKPRMPWAQRMIQLQVTIVYLATCYWKTLGPTWLDGTALYYVLHLSEFRRFPVPDISSLGAIKLMTWLTLAIEGAVGILVWFRELRYPVLATAACLHLGIEYSMNIPLFQWVMIATYATFIYPEDLTRIWVWMSAHMPRRVVSREHVAQRAKK